VKKFSVISNQFSENKNYSVAEKPLNPSKSHEFIF
jgi:hypothetical protein